MKKRWMQLVSISMALAITFGSTVNVLATANGTPDTSAAADEDAAPTSGQASPGTGADDDKAPNTPDPKPTDSKPADTESSQQADKTDTSTGAPSAGGSPGSDTNNGAGAADKTDTNGNGTGSDGETGALGTGGSQGEPQTEQATEKKEDFSGTVTVDEDIKGVVTVEEDKNDDKVEIKKNDRPYLALGADLTAEQRATVLALMGVEAGKLDQYDVVYVNNSEEHQYLGSYIDSSKIGSRSLSSIVIVQREDGNGINISTNNISYCTVGMYKNALATAGIQNADIIVAAPFPISGTAALVGVFKAYTEMTGDQIDEENIDAALHELVVTGALEASGGDADEIEGMIAYVKQAVVEHDLSDEADIRDAIAKGCKKFDITLNDEEVNEIVNLMSKISELDLDLDKILNAAQSIYDKISNADGGFWAKIRELLNTLLAKIKELF